MGSLQFGILVIGILEIWDHGNLGSWEFGTLAKLESWEFGILRIWKHGNLGSWEFKILGIWDLGNLGLPKLGIFGICSCNPSVAVAILVLQVQY